VDVQVSMSTMRSIGRQALGAFFQAMQPERAHWYSILLPMKATPGFDESHYAAFPPLSKLSSINEDIFREVLVHCELAMYRKNSGYSPLEKEWSYFNTEQGIPEAEITHLSLGNKKRLYIRLGTWNKGQNHLPRTPENIWLAAQAGTLRVPRVCMTLISEKFAKRIGMLELNQHLREKDGKSTSINEGSDSVEGTDDDSRVEMEIDENECENDDGGTILPDRENFPLLHSLFAQNKGGNVLNRLINELLRFNGSRVMNYAKGNNTLGTLLEVPQFRSLRGYEKDFKKKGSMLDEICNAVARCARVDRSEACEAILSSFYDLHRCSI